MSERVFFAWVLSCLTVFAASGGSANLTLAERGKTADCAIVIPCPADETVRYAAEELRGGIEPKTSEVSSDYRWYDVLTWEPKLGEYLWTGPGPMLICRALVHKNPDAPLVA